VIVLRQHIFWHAWWDRSIKMTTEGKDKVSTGNQIPIDKDKLKEE
jgi:hypothetical protein